MESSLILLLIPLIAFLGAQALKLIPLTIQHGFKISHLWAYGNMPSSHTAFVSSVSTVAALHDGINSMVFAVAVVFSLLVVRDAIGLRRHMSAHAEVVNDLTRRIAHAEGKPESQYPHLTEGIGHKPAEIIAGGLFGIGLTWLLYLLFA